MVSSSIRLTDPTQQDMQSRSLLAGGGELGELIGQRDWSQTPLGPIDRWPRALKTAVRIMITSRQPMFVWWGDELINLYNDAYKSVVCGKHPQALGQPAAKVWSEVWDLIAPRVRSAMVENEGTYDDALLFIMERNGYPEEAYYTFSYNPLPDDEGGIGGIFCANTDETQRVIGERQLGLLRDLASRAGDCRTVADACAHSIQSLETDPRDIPFAMVYLFDSMKQRMVLAGAAGIAKGDRAAPDTVGLNQNHGWPFGEVMQTNAPCVVTDLSFAGPLPAGIWPRAPLKAVVLPIDASRENGPYGVLVAGLNPYRLYDHNYEGFLQLVAGRVAAAIANGQAYEEERRRVEALAELDRAKTAFFNNVSHEFRTPLTLMLGPLEELVAKREEMSADSGALAQVVHRNGLRLLKLVNSLLDFARFEAGRAESVFEPTDLAQLTSDLASSFRAAVEKAGMRLEVDCPSLEEPAYVDREMWEKVVLNLLSNAFKFTFDGWIRVALKRVGDWLVLEVSDTGVGIPEAELPHVFTRFHQVKGSRGRTLEGTGIGLALAQEIIGQHHGTIRAESRVGAGSRFTVEIPAGRSHLPPERLGGARSAASTAIHADAYVFEALHWLPGGSSPQPTTGEKMHGSVFIAEDNSDMREYLIRLLEKRYRVQMFSDGEAALEAVRANPPDLLLSDVMMPRMSGFELVKRIRSDERLRDVRVVLLSAHAGEEAKVEGLECGADDYLVKPFAANELLARVRSNLEMGRTRTKMERRLRDTQRLESIGLLAGGIAHDFNNLLMGVMGNASLLLENLRPENPDRAVAEEIINATQMAANLTRQLLAYAGKGKVSVRLLDLTRLVREMKSLLRLSIPKKVELEFNLASRLPSVKADATQMQQVIMNLAINGAEAIGEGKSGKVCISSSMHSGQVVVEVTDTGCGMSAETAAKVFDPFFTTKFTGRGLGLAAAQGIIHAHNGSIQVSSVPGHGAMFRFALPAAGPALEEVAVASVSIAVEQAGGGTILVVDDEMMVRTLLEKLLKRQGYDVLLAENGAVALDVFEKNRERVSLVLLDWAMPVMDGQETLRRLGSLRPELPVIVSSGYNDAETVEHAGAGYVGFIQKPYQHNRILEMIKAALSVR